MSRKLPKRLQPALALFYFFFFSAFRRCFGEAYYFLAESPSSLACSAGGGTANTPDVANHGMTAIVNHPGVPIHLFTRHVLERHANDNEGFAGTFEHIESLAANSSPTKENLASLLPHNDERNRYKNVLACEYSMNHQMRFLSP